MRTCALAGAPLAVVLVLATSIGALAERPATREWSGRAAGDPLRQHDLPMLFRSSAGTTWVRVHPAGLSPCAPADTLGSPGGQSVEHVWCFEGAGGDSTWPARGSADAQGAGDWAHWSRFAPPGGAPSRWNVSGRHGDASTGTWNAWAGCDSVPGDADDAACADVAYWVFRDGYGNDWNFALQLDVPGASTLAGGTLTFDLRYDTECDYDYLYLEYLDRGGGLWRAVTDTAGVPAVFNGVSGVPDSTHGGDGRACGGDLYGHSDRIGGVPQYGSSTWLHGVSLPLPSQAGGLSLRWRASSDGAWSDADGRGDTDGLGAIDNVSVAWEQGGPQLVTDDFESGDFLGIAGTMAAAWTRGGPLGNTYDGWHLDFDPMYKNQGNSCTFSDDWMWTAKPPVGPIPENEFDYLLASPRIACAGWTGAVCEFAEYVCLPDPNADFTYALVRVHDGTLGGWSPWDPFDGFLFYGGCETWSTNEVLDLTPSLAAGVDSLQLAWEILDLSEPGDYSWGKHAATQFLIDNVSFGSFDATATSFTYRSIDLLADGFSRSDPAHTPFLGNDEQGDWVGVGGARALEAADSLSLFLTDPDGITEGNVVLWWRHDDATGPVDSVQTFGSWRAKPMDLSVRWPFSSTDEGTYRMTFGADDGGIEDVDGTAGNGLVWKAGVTVEYYVRVLDDLGQEVVWPPEADPAGGDPSYPEFSVLPFGLRTPDEDLALLVVDDFGRQFLDFEHSTGFDPAGGVGFGGFAEPVFAPAEALVVRALARLFLPSGTDGERNPAWDAYDVLGAGSSVQCEPRGRADPARGLGGFLDASGVPQYDVILWIQGNFADYSYSEESRLALMEHLDGSGHLVSCADDVAFYLGAGGIDADSTLGFLGDYLGTAFASVADDATEARVLDVTGTAGSSMDGVTLGLYGECPLRRRFDRLELAVPAPLSENGVLMTYTNGGAGDEGRAAVVWNARFADPEHTIRLGVAVHAGFDLSAFLSTDARACLLHNVFEGDFGLEIARSYSCFNTSAAPDLGASAFGFSLAAASPSPFRETTVLRFGVPARTHVTLVVYDVLGRRVRALVDEVLEADRHERTWDGCDESGRRVSSGVYFVELTAGEFRATRKVVRLR